MIRRLLLFACLATIAMTCILLGRLSLDMIRPEGWNVRANIGLGLFVAVISFGNGFFGRAWSDWRNGRNGRRIWRDFLKRSDVNRMERMRAAGPINRGDRGHQPNQGQ